MFCKECGKSINDDSKFCSYCGSKVEPINKTQAFETLGDDQSNVRVFEPKAASSTDSHTAENNAKGVNLKRTAHFDWDLDGFPTDEGKKEKKVSIKWEDVLMSATSDDNSTKMKRKLEGRKTDGFFFSPDSGHGADNLRDGYDGDDLQQIIFGDEARSDALSDDGMEFPESGDSIAVNKFYTFNKKNEEFQRLLDREYEKLKSDDNLEDIESENGLSEDEPTLDMQDVQKGGQESEGVSPSFPKPKDESGDFAKDEDANMGVLADGKQVDGDGSGSGNATGDGDHSEGTDGGETREGSSDLATETTAEDGAPDGENAEDATPGGAIAAGAASAESIAEARRKRRGRADHRKKTKFDFSAIFDDADTVNNGGSIEQEKTSNKADESKETVVEEKAAVDLVPGISNDAESDEEYVKPKSKGMKAISVAFYIVLLLVIIILGIKLVAPDSSLAVNIDRTYETIVNKITGKTPQGAQVEENKTIDDWIADAASANQNISKIQSNPDIKVNIANKDFKGVDTSKPFTDSIWYTTDDGKDVYYGGEIVKSVVAYYSDLNTSSGGINDVKVENLKIGEIRTGEFGFFVATSINDDKDSKGIYNLYIEPEGTVMKVSDSIAVEKTEE